MRGETCPHCNADLSLRASGESCWQCLATEEELDERAGTSEWRSIAEQSYDGWTEQTTRSDRAFFESFNGGNNK